VRRQVDGERYEKKVFFETQEQRDLFCDLLQALTVSGPNTYQIFKVRAPPICPSRRALPC
jgi:hypothetical protein